MLMHNNVCTIVKDGLCTSCGICRGACHLGCISFEYGQERNVPVVDTRKCVNCGRCYEVCPGKGTQLKAMGKSLYGSQEKIQENNVCGYWLSAYTGHSADKEIRYHSSSGGMVTSFLIYLLEKQMIDGALVVGYNKNNPIEPEPYIATTKEEILKSRGSKYVVVSYDRIIEKVLNFKGKLVVVGLPCQIQGLRMLADKDKHFRQHIMGYFSIYCSLNKTKHSMSYYLKKYKISPDNISYFSFRDDGCLGFMKFASKDGKVITRIPYLSFWFGTHSFFQNKRCLLCADHYGELADISFGDINIEPYNQDKIGISSLVVRSKIWDDYLNDCFNENKIVLESCSIDDINRSQQYARIHKKGVGIQSFMKFRSLLGLKNPHYDIEYNDKPSFKNFISVLVKYLMIWIGAHQSLWFVVDKLDKSDRQIEIDR